MALLFEIIICSGQLSVCTTHTNANANRNVRSKSMCRSNAFFSGKDEINTIIKYTFKKIFRLILLIYDNKRIANKLHHSIIIIRRQNCNTRDFKKTYPMSQFALLPSHNICNISDCLMVINK